MTSYKKAVEENMGLTKDINNMSAFINISAPSLGEKGTKTFEDLKRQMVQMEGHYSMTKYSSKKIPRKPSKIVKIWRLCFK